jgi:hypothetical protein
LGTLRPMFVMLFDDYRCFAAPDEHQVEKAYCDEDGHDFLLT